MSEDPLAPASHRFPRDAWPPGGSDEAPSPVRPFALRGARVGEEVVTAKHRTPATQKPQTITTTRDGKDGSKTVPDTHYVPDD